MGAKMHLWSSAIIQWDISHVKFVLTAVNHVLIEILMMFSTRIVIPNINCLHRSAVSYIWDEHEICKFLLRWFKEDYHFDTTLNSLTMNRVFYISYRIIEKTNMKNRFQFFYDYFSKLNLIWKCLQTLH